MSALFRRLRCRLSGHKIVMFPPDGGNVAYLAYTCGCGRAWISRELRDASLNAKLDEFNGVGAA